MDDSSLMAAHRWLSIVTSKYGCSWVIVGGDGQMYAGRE